MSIAKHALKLFAVIVGVFFVGLLLEMFIEKLPGSSNLLEASVEILCDLFPVFVALSIFAMTWFAYSKSRDNHSLFIGMAFLVIGLIDLFHVLSYPFMPDFITSNSLQKAGILHNEARLISAVLFLISAYVYRDTLPKLINQPVLFTSAIVLFFISLVPALSYPDNLPVLYGDGGFSAALISRQFITTVIILYASYLYTKRILDAGQQHLISLIYGFIILIFSDLVYFDYDIPGHLLKLTGFIFIHLSLYKSSVELPYEKLALAEEKLKKSEARLRLQIDRMPIGCIVWNSDFHVISWNPAAEEIFGFKAEEVMGKHPYDLIVPREAQPHMDTIWRRPLEGDATAHNVNENMTKDGRTIICSWSNTPLKEADGTVIGVLSMVQDITERKRAEETRLEKERLEYASKAKSDFLATMSHELRTPLNSIIGFSELLKQKIFGELNEKQEHYMDNVLTSSKFLLDLINDILDLSKVEAGKIELVIEKISVPEAINDAVTLIKENAAKRKVIIKKEIDPQLEIEADRQRFKQILFNLLSNAVKFSKGEGGPVTIAAKKEDGMARITVSDTGVGIREEDMGKLFKEFEQLDPGISKKYGGTGLGLAITKKLVDLHGGKIWAESKYGEGSTFTFLMPLAAKKE